MKRFKPSKSFRYVASIAAILFGTPLSADTCDAMLMKGSIAQLNATHSTVSTSVLINAQSGDVWRTLTDFKVMPSWSTGTLQGITGDIKNGGSVVVTFLFGTDENGNPIANEIPHTLIYEDGKKFGWSDPFPAEIGGGHDNHIYRVQPCGDQTLFVQSDEIVDNPYAADFAAQLLPMYQLFNAELKATVEN